MYWKNVRLIGTLEIFLFKKIESIDNAQEIIYITTSARVSTY